MNGKTLKTAIIQEPPVFFNLAATISKFEKLLVKSVENGARLAVFPETWLPGYPVWIDSAPGAAMWGENGAKFLYSLLYKNSLSLKSKEFEQIREMVNRHEMTVVLGINEKFGSTLYNTMLFIDGVKKEYKIHRKLVPTYTERMIWGRGDGSTFSYLTTDYGNIGGLICWEHWMPFARAVMHSFNEVVHIAQWPSVRELHQLASRHYAFEGKCYVIASGTVVRKEDVIDGFISTGSRDQDALNLLNSIQPMKDGYIYDGGSCVIAPDSTYEAGPIFDEAGIVFADIALDEIHGEYMYLDTDGHYSRPDIFSLDVNTAEQINVNFINKK